MALDPGSRAWTGSPESSGRDSPIPRQWRNQLSGEEVPTKDKAYRRYASGVEKALSLFETALEEWADYISFLNRVLKSLQARPSSNTTIPEKALLSKRLSQCLNPTLPSGVHQKALEVYTYVFDTIGADGLSRDLPLYLPGLAPTLSFASLSVRSPFLELLEKYFLKLDARSLRPAMRSIILALLPGLEDETSEDFDRTLRLVGSFKKAIRPTGSKELTGHHSVGDDFFWQCFFLASITSHSRRAGALAYLVRHLPVLGAPAGATEVDEGSQELATMVTSPEPGLLVRCFASGLADEQVLIQRGFLDLLVTHLALNSKVLQTRVKSSDLELLLKSAVGVVIRRDMSLNRRLWAWLLGPEPVVPETEQAHDASGASSEQQHADLSFRTQYFEEHGLAALTRALLAMIKDVESSSVSERARPYRICLSLMDRWEIGGLVVPEIFLPIVQSVQRFKQKASSPAEFKEVLRSASVFFDGIESGLIYSEIVALLAQAIGPGSLGAKQRSEKLSLISFIVANFNVREEEMVTIHAPLTCLAALYMLEDRQERHAKGGLDSFPVELANEVLSIVASFLDLIPERAFPAPSTKATTELKAFSLSNMDLLKKIRNFYVNEQGNLDASPAPFTGHESGQLLIRRAAKNVYGGDKQTGLLAEISLRVRIFLQVLTKTPKQYEFEDAELLTFTRRELSDEKALPFAAFSSILTLVSQMYYTGRITLPQLCDLVLPLVRHAWSYLSVSEPKYHVETVRGLWQLQTALTLERRDIEAALSTLIVEKKNRDNAEMGRTFGVLWSHTLQDSQGERRGSRTASLAEPRPRLAGADLYEVMLTQPLFLVLDALMDERTHLYMNVKSWLNSMVGIDRLFLLFASKISALTFLKSIRKAVSTDELDATSQQFAEGDDLDLCLYYLRTMHNVLGCTGEAPWAIMGSKHVAPTGENLHISTGGEGNEMTLQELLLRILIRCVAGKSETPESDLVDRTCQLQRYTLMILHQFLIASQSSRLSHFHVENILIDRLRKSIAGPDPYIQVLLLDCVFAALKLQEPQAPERPLSATSEKYHSSTTDLTRPGRSSISNADNHPPQHNLPPQLLKCLLSGLGAQNSQLVLDSWMTFLGGCLPLYGGSIFQIVIPLVETLCKQISTTFANLRATFDPANNTSGAQVAAPETTLIYLLNGLEQVLARAHDQLLADEARAQVMKSPDQPQSLFGSMVSGVFQSDAPQGRSATANDRLTVHLAFQDAVRICYKIWSWGQGDDAAASDTSAAASFMYTSLRMRNRARRLLEHLFTAETLECLETIVDIWKQAPSEVQKSEVFKFLAALEASRPRQTVPSIFNSIYSRTNPSALDPSRTSTLTISLDDTDLGLFLVKYTQSLDDDAMDEIWQDCIIFLKDILANPFPHRQTLPSLIEFAAILGEKVDNTNFGEQRKMRRELGDLFIRLLAGLFTTRPITFAETTSPNAAAEKSSRGGSVETRDVVGILASVVPNLSKVLPEPDRVLSAAGTISTNVIGPTFRTKSFPDSVTRNTVRLLHELSRLPNNQKSWKKDVGEAFNDGRFFGMGLSLVTDDWLPLLRQWTVADKEKLPEIVGRIAAPTTAGIVFGVGATSARLEADRKTQLNLRRVATLLLAGADEAFVTDLPAVVDKLVELLAASATSSPSSTTRADVYMVMRALVLRTNPLHLAALWPIVNAELHAALSSVVAPDGSPAAETHSANAGVLQACKLLDLLVCVAPDDFQLHEWLFITDSIDAVYRSSSSRPVALADEISEDLGSAAATTTTHHDDAAAGDGGGLVAAAQRSRRHLLIGPGGISDDVGLERRDELVAKVLRPFFGQLSIFAFESTYAMGAPDVSGCVQSLLRDLFDDRTMVKAL
ncbi:hypothetical protein LMH87_003663 [Akanthomyces muscarius]|uniref:Dopey N-terminal domain-containing protein n=1 Tax=Akanthomyces muscarius TaxID=2231603 RepID=A0A9W8UGU8_AKAMU|nr:hypothetical protein LMH87_003663 [Akanthomyces muscarius]KAJ4144793.1 hypothetical protein LMH87_003663 [Akanthomyces muscarius]